MAAYLLKSSYCVASFPGFTIAIGVSTRVKPGNEATVV